MSKTAKREADAAAAGQPHPLRDYGRHATESEIHVNLLTGEIEYVSSASTSYATAVPAEI